jgi:tetratricopeptide (TPR) repeat protein
MSDNINMKNMAKDAERQQGVPKNIPPELVPVYDWWVKDGKSTIATIVVVGMIAGAFYGVKGWFKSRDAAANAAVTQAYSSQVNVSDLEASVAQYGSTKVGVPLKLRLASEYYDSGVYDKALATYDEIIANNASSASYIDIAVIGRAYALEGLKRYDDAQKAYDDFVKDESNASSYLALTAKIGAIRCRVLVKQNDASFAKERDAAVKELEDLKKNEKGIEEIRIDNLISTLKRFDAKRFEKDLLRASDAAKLLTNDDLFKLADAVDEKPAEKKEEKKADVPEKNNK